MENEKTELKMIRMSEIETQEIKWLGILLSLTGN